MSQLAHEHPVMLFFLVVIVLTVVDNMVVNISLALAKKPRRGVPVANKEGL